MKKFISGAFCPTQVVMIDDNSQILKSIEMGLDPSLGFYRVFSDPRKGLFYINETSQTYKHHYLTRDNVEVLYQEVYNTKRFNQISAIIVDYDMPGLNGLELCEQIEDPHIQKILLTGAASEFLAVDAFNEGVINYFVRKQDPQAPYKLNNFVIEAQSRYFRSLSKPLINALAQDPMETAISDPVFVEFFARLLEEKNIREYYLLDATGSFLLLDKRGNISALFIYTSDLLSINEEMIKSEVKDHLAIDKKLVEDLLLHKKAICFHYFEDAHFPEPADWHEYSYPLFRLEGERQNYYWSYVPAVKDIDKGKILSFDTFKASML